MQTTVIQTVKIGKKKFSLKLFECHYGVILWCFRVIGNISGPFWAFHSPRNKIGQNQSLQKWDFVKIQFLTSNSSKTGLDGHFYGMSYHWILHYIGSRSCQSNVIGIPTSRVQEPITQKPSLQNPLTVWHFFRIDKGFHHMSITHCEPYITGSQFWHFWQKTIFRRFFKWFFIFCALWCTFNFPYGKYA